MFTSDDAHKLMSLSDHKKEALEFVDGFARNRIETYARAGLSECFVKPTAQNAIYEMLDLFRKRGFGAVAVIRYDEFGWIKVSW